MAEFAGVGPSSWVWPCTVVIALASGGTARGADHPHRPFAEALTVMVRASFPGVAHSENGAGIIVASRESTLYIVTARHVIQRPSGSLSKDIQVWFRWLNRQGAPPRSLKAIPAEGMRGDLAVLTVQLDTHTLPRPDTLSFAALGDETKLVRDRDGVRPLGQPGEDMWSTCNEPDYFDSLDGDKIYFRSGCVRRGHSGGPLLDEDWRIVGMVFDDSHPLDRAVDIDAVIAILGELKIPVDLVHDREADLNVFAGVSVGDSESCGVTLRNRIYCWGRRDVGLRVDVRHRFSTVSSGWGHHCALSLGGAAFCWGDDSGSVPFLGDAKGGLLGSGVLRSSERPVPVRTELVFRTISAGAMHTCAIAADEQAYCWGNNSWGQLGVGNRESAAGRNGPVAVAGSRRWSQVSAGSAFTCGIDASQELYCWGDAFRADDEPEAKARLVPYRLPTSLRFTHVSAGGGGDTRMACAIATDGALYCWGTSSRFIGITTNSIVDAPVRTVPEFQFKHVAVGERHVCGVRVDGRIVCWGHSTFGQAGPRHADQPQVIEGITGAETVSANAELSCAVRHGGEALCWGYDTNRLGFGASSFISSTDRATFPVRISRCVDDTAADDLGTIPDLLGDWHIDPAELANGLMTLLRERGVCADQSGTFAKVGDVLKEVSTALQTTRGKIRTCEAAQDDPAARRLEALWPLVQNLELHTVRGIDGLSFLALGVPGSGPNLSEIREKCQAAASVANDVIAIATGVPSTPRRP